MEIPFFPSMFPKKLKFDLEKPFKVCWSEDFIKHWLAWFYAVVCASAAATFPSTSCTTLISVIWLALEPCVLCILGSLGRLLFDNLNAVCSTLAKSFQALANGLDFLFGFHSIHWWFEGVCRRLPVCLFGIGFWPSFQDKVRFQIIHYSDLVAWPIR